MIWEKIDESTYQYDEGGVRFFLLMGKKEALLIDSGNARIWKCIR